MTAPRSSLVARLIALVAIVSVCYLGWSEFRRFDDLRAAVGPTVDYDVPRARKELTRRLHALERETSRLAEQALEATSGLTDAADQFGALREIDLPADAGLILLDVHDQPLAWMGATEEAALALVAEGNRTRTFTTPDTRQLAVVHTQSSPVPNVPVVAIAHRPYHSSYRLLDPVTLEADIERGFRVGRVRVVHDLSSTDGEPVASQDGGSLARVVVAPLSRESWIERVERDATSRRVGIVVVLLLAGLAWLWHHTRRRGDGVLPGSRRPHLLRAVGTAAACAALLFLPLQRLLPPEHDLVDPDVYGGSAAGNPLALLLTCAAALGVATCLRRAAAPRRATQESEARTHGPAWNLLLPLVAVGGRLVLEWLIADVTANSRAEFFPAQSLFPAAGPAVVLLALVCAAGAVLAVLRMAWARSWFATHDRAIWVGTLVLAVVLAPIGPGDADLTGLLPLAWVAMAPAIAGFAYSLATPARAGLVPLALALALFPAVERSLATLRQDEALMRSEELTPSDDTVDRARIREALEQAASSEVLREGLNGPRLPDGIARDLWSQSSLPDTPRGSGIFIEPFLGGPRGRQITVDLSPQEWMDLPTRPNTETWIERVGGKGLGTGGEWLIGETPVTAAGRDTPAATVRVVIERRSPYSARLPDLDLLVTPTRPGLREPLTVEVTDYDPSGRLASGTAERALAGASLEPRQIQRAMADPAARWLTTESGGRTLRVHLSPADDEAGTRAVAFDTGGTGALLLRVTKLAVLGTLAALVALALTLHRWALGMRLQLAGRLVLAFVLVSAGPIVVLTWATSRIVDLRRTAVDRRDLQEAVDVVASMVAHDPEVSSWVTYHQDGGAPGGEPLRPLAYSLGHHANFFERGELLTSSDPGLVEIGVLPRRLPGDAYHEIALLRRPLHISREEVGGYEFDVGYAPSRVGDGLIVSVPVLHRRTERDREMVEFFTTVLGFYLLSLVGAIAGGTWLAARLTRPLRELTGATRRVAAGDLSSPVPAVGPGEFAEVVHAFNGMMRDLAESRERLVQAEKEAAWREMARQVAHEVKNPLTPMRLAAEHLRRAHNDRSPRFAEILERSVAVIVRQTEALKRIATDFSAFARLPRQHRERVAVRRLVEEIGELYQGVPQLEVTVELPDDDPHVLADPDELKRVLINLVGNAVEAIDGAPGTIHCRLRVDPDRRVRIEIEDDGPGIPEESRQHLFEPSFSTKTGGTGLGLAICKRAVEDLGGSIAITSRIGEGTLVTMHLPIADGDATPES